MVKPLILFALLIIPISSFSQKITFKTIGFKLDPIDSAKIQRMASYEAKIFNGLYDNFLNDSLKITLNLYGKRKDFMAIVSQQGMRGLTESGFYNPAKDESYIYFEGIENLNTVLHELSHAFLKNNSRFYPKWLNEGLAEFLETLEENQFGIQIVSQSSRIERMKGFQQNKKLDLQTFLQDHAAWRDKKQLAYMYTTSYCLIYFLYKRDAKLISTMTQLYKNGKTDEEIFSQLFNGYRNLERGFNFYFR